MQRPISAERGLKSPVVSRASREDRQVPGSSVSKGSRRKASLVISKHRRRSAPARLHPTATTWASHVLAGIRIPGPIGSSVCYVERHSYLAGASLYSISTRRGMSAPPMSPLKYPTTPQPHSSILLIASRVRNTGRLGYLATPLPHTLSSRRLHEPGP